MADYNIYIHNISGSAADSPTTAWTGNPQSQTTPTQVKEQESGGGGGFSSVLGAIGAGSKLFSTETLSALGVSGIVEIVPYIAAAGFAMKTATKITDTILPFVTRDTGDYTFATSWSNLKATVNAIFHPVSTVISGLKMAQEVRHDFLKKEQDRLLVGEVYINSGRKF